MLCSLMEFPKFLIMGWYRKILEEADTDEWATHGMEANLDGDVHFVSLFEKLSLHFLVAASPGFADQAQFTLRGNGYDVVNLYFFLFSDWKTGWTLLYKPINENERKIIDEILKVSLFRVEFKLFSEMQRVFNQQIL